MFEIENLDKLNNLKANPNSINLDTQNQVYEMRYNTDRDHPEFCVTAV